MKIRSSLRAGARTCPEAQDIQQKVLKLQARYYNCNPQTQNYNDNYGVYPSYNGAYYPPQNGGYYPPQNGGFVGSTYPDRSGWCG